MRPPPVSPSLPPLPQVRRICDAFGAKRFAVPDTGGHDGGRAVAQAMDANRAEIADARTVLVKNRETRHVLCRDLASSVQGWLWHVLREKAVFATLNTLKPDVSGMLRGEGWVVARDLAAVRAAVERAHGRVALGGACVVERLPRPWPTPPTSFVLNSFTTPYQVGPLPPPPPPMHPCTIPRAHARPHRHALLLCWAFRLSFQRVAFFYSWGRAPFSPGPERPPLAPHDSRWAAGGV